MFELALRNIYVSLFLYLRHIVSRSLEHYYTSIWVHYTPTPAKTYSTLLNALQRSFEIRNLFGTCFAVIEWKRCGMKTSLSSQLRNGVTHQVHRKGGNMVDGSPIKWELTTWNWKDFQYHNRIVNGLQYNRRVVPGRGYSNYYQSLNRKLNRIELARKNFNVNIWGTYCYLIPCYSCIEDQI